MPSLMEELRSSTISPQRRLELLDMLYSLYRHGSITSDLFPRSALQPDDRYSGEEVQAFGIVDEIIDADNAIEKKTKASRYDFALHRITRK